MTQEQAAAQVIALYPRVFFACHMQHVRDPKTRRRLSAHQASILDHLDAVEPTSLTGLALHMGVTPSTMSLAIDRLVRAGYVLRERDALDARRVNLRLSPAGERIKEAQSVLDPQLVRSLVGRLAEAQREEGVRGLAILAAAATEQMKERSQQGSWTRRRRMATANH